MTVKEDLASYLQENELGTIGETIWGELPVGKEESLGIVESPSPEPNKAIDIFEQSLDVYGRFAKATVGRDRMQAVFDLLHKRANFQLENYHVYLCYATGMIEDLDRDAEDRHVYKLSFVFVCRKLVEGESP